MNAAPETHAESLRVFAERYYAWLRVVQYSELTIESKREALDAFISWCEDRGLEEIGQISPGSLERYQRYLHHYRNEKTGRALAVGTQYSRLTMIRSFFKWLTKKRFLSMNPAGELELPKIPYRLPRDVLTAVETERVLATIKLETPAGVRDRAMLEVFYSTGLRRRELVLLKLRDVDMERGLVLVREGKGKQDRVVPIGERALKWLEKYLDEVRPEFVKGPDPEFIFLTNRGRALHPGQITQLAGRYVRSSSVEKNGACHIFRHTMATLMLENEVDIRFIQAMLGHKSLKTTDIYTHVAIRKLKEIHTAKHPAAKLRAPAKDKAAADDTPSE